MGNAADVLNQLRDIHMPEYPSWWPPAPGWWLVGFLLIATLVWSVNVIRKKRIASLPRRLALQEFDDLLQSDSRHIAAELSALLKRAAIKRYGRDKVAGLGGDRWLSFLDHTSGSREFSQGAGRVLMHGPYQAAGTHDFTQVAPLVRKWLVENL